MAGKKIFEITENICRNGSHGGFSRLLLLILIGIGFIIGYKYCRKRLNKQRSQMHIPLMTGDGYSCLKTEDVQPAFV